MSNIGIAICDCGNTLLTQEHAAQIMANVSCQGSVCEHVFQVTAACSEEGRATLSNAVKEKGVEKLVFAGCSPIQNQAALEAIASQAGLTPSAVHGVNIKEQIFLRATDKSQAVKQASKAIQKTVNALSEVPVFEMKRVPLHQNVLVIGGGAGGVYAAHEIQQLGYSTILIEQAEEPGGQSFPEFPEETFSAKSWQPPSEMLAGIEVFTQSSLVELTGQIGAFAARIRTPDGETTVQCGAVVIASGKDLTHKISDSPHILSITELHLALADLAKRRGLRTIGLVLDKDIDETKASTEMALKLAKKIQHMKRYQAHLFCRDIRVAARDLELLYDEAREAGVSILKYDDALTFKDTEYGVHVTYHDAVLCQEMTVYCDRIAVSPYGISSSNGSFFAERLGISTDAYGQFQDNNIHLFPEQTNRPGIFVLGSCRGQYYIPQIIEEAKAIASTVHELLSQKALDVELSNAEVDPEKCVLCLTCVRSCPYKAMFVNKEEAAAESLPEVCQKCGICAGECPAKAITLPVYSDNVILSQVV